jgi:hypothetical protein
LQKFESTKFLVPIVYLSKQPSGRHELIHVDCNTVPCSSPTGPTAPHSSPHLLLSPDAPDAEKRWTTIEQCSWLEDRIPAFIEAKATGAFFDDIHTGWQKNWPTEAPKQQELKNANGNAERALAIKQKASEDVSS